MRNEHVKGRGAGGNPGNRFERARMEVDPELVVMEGLVDEVEVNQEGVRRMALTQFLRDRSCSIVSRNESPDVPFEVSVNAYRGCEHGWPCFVNTPQRLSLLRRRCHGMLNVGSHL